VQHSLSVHVCIFVGCAYQGWRSWPIENIKLVTMNDQSSTVCSCGDMNQRIPASYCYLAPYTSNADGWRSKFLFFLCSPFMLITLYLEHVVLLGYGHFVRSGVIFCCHGMDGRKQWMDFPFCMDAMDGQKGMPVLSSETEKNSGHTLFFIQFGSTIVLRIAGKLYSTYSDLIANHIQTHDSVLDLSQPTNNFFEVKRIQAFRGRSEYSVTTAMLTTVNLSSTMVMWPRMENSAELNIFR